MPVAIGIFVVALGIIVSDRVHRTKVALAGAVAIVVTQTIGQERAIAAIDFNTLGLLAGMMLIFRLTETTGIYAYLAIRAGQLAGGRPVLDARKSIVDPDELRRSLPVLLGTILLFFVHEPLHLEPATVARSRRPARSARSRTASARSRGRSHRRAAGNRLALGARVGDRRQHPVHRDDDPGGRAAAGRRQRRRLLVGARARRVLRRQPHARRRGGQRGGGRDGRAVAGRSASSSSCAPAYRRRWRRCCSPRAISSSATRKPAYSPARRRPGTRVARHVRSASLLLVLLGVLAVSPAAQARGTVERTLGRLADRGSFTRAELAAWRADWRQARTAVRRLDGAERRSLAGVIANTRSLAARRMLAARARPAFATLRHNLDWFVVQGAEAPGNGTRTGFATDVVWQFYDGSGWQFQPLGSFGSLNALLARRHAGPRVRALADDLLRLGVERKGFLAFEYLFPWGGGRPGWISGMAQATAMQALSRAAARLGEPRLMAAATRMRPAFERRPPWGVRRRTRHGTHYLLYSQSPRLLVGNAFAQTLIGLSDYRRLSGDPHTAKLVEEGLAQARWGLPRLDTGAWSLYSRTPAGPGTESDLHYHRVFTGFLERLCAHLHSEPFCGLAQRFLAYEYEPVAITRVRTKRHRHRVVVTLRVSKRSHVTVSLRRQGRTLDRMSRLLLRGPERFVFHRRARRPVAIRVDATSLTGVHSSISG
jgi:hypothetical protein